MWALERAGEGGLPLPRAQDSTWGYSLTVSETKNPLGTLGDMSKGPQMRAGLWPTAVK